MSRTTAKVIFSEGMFEHALSHEAWKEGEGVDRAAEPVEASVHLAGLAQTVGLHEISEPTGNGVPGGDAPEAEPESSHDEEVCHKWRLNHPEQLFRVFDETWPMSYVEQFQLLRTQLLLMRSQFPSEDAFRCICVTSALAGEGKTFTARNLAATMASASGKRVLIVEAASREASLPESMPGLDFALTNPNAWRRATADLAGSTLSVLAGPRFVSQTDFEPLPALITSLRQHFDWVIIDGPSIHSLAPAEWVLAAADATLFVVREGAPSFDNLGDALSRVPRERLAGVVMNRMVAPKRSWLPKIRIRVKTRSAA
jgi:Mrp family chromosome partitioning ATPase